MCGVRLTRGRVLLTPVARAVCVGARFFHCFADGIFVRKVKSESRRWENNVFAAQRANLRPPVRFSISPSWEAADLGTVGI